MRSASVLLLALAVLAAGWAPAPFPKPPRHSPPPLQMAGAWDVKWDESAVRLDLRADGSARFAYTSGGGTYQGTWKYHGAKRQVALTLQVGGQPRLYEMDFDEVSATAAKGKVKQGPSTPWAVTMVRAK